MDKARVKSLVSSLPFQSFIFAVIVVNAITIGFETCNISEEANAALETFDVICLVIYVIEVSLKIYAYESDFFKHRWNVFDLVIISLSVVALVFSSLPVQIVRIIRLFRVARVFMIVSFLKQMRIVVEAIGRAIPGVLWTLLLLLIVVYVFDVAGVFLFAERCPEYFGDLATGLWSLFKVVTLEGWPEIAHGVMVEYEFAWLYFAPFIVFASLIMLNIVLGIILDTVEGSRQAHRIAPGDANEQLGRELDGLRRQIENVQQLLDRSEEEITLDFADVDEETSDDEFDESPHY